MSERRLTEAEQEAVNKRASERAMRKYAPASILEAAVALDEPMPSAERATKTIESATTRTEKNMSERIVVNSLSELVNIVRAGIAPGVRVFMPNPNTLDDSDSRDVVE